MIEHFVMYAVFLVVAVVVVHRAERTRRRRAGRRRALREIWEKRNPGELTPECPVCRLPYPVSFAGCPFCGRFRVEEAAEAPGRSRVGGLRFMR